VRFTTGSPDEVRTAAVKPAPVNSLKALLGLRDRVRVICIEIVPGIAGAIHHDLCGHRILRCKVPEFHARFRLPRKPNNALAVN
jgi:hypothetical protein